jgi:hypothetical protein
LHVATDSPTRRIERLSDQIETFRQELNRLSYTSVTLHSDKIVEVSARLDELIVEYTRLMK